MTSTTVTFPTAPSATSVPELDMEEQRRDLYAALQRIEDLRDQHPYEALGHSDQAECVPYLDGKPITIGN